MDGFAPGALAKGAGVFVLSYVDGLHERLADIGEKQRIEIREQRIVRDRRVGMTITRAPGQGCLALVGVTLEFYFNGC